MSEVTSEEPAKETESAATWRKIRAGIVSALVRLALYVVVAFMAASQILKGG